MTGQDIYEIRRNNLWMLQGLVCTQRNLSEQLSIQAHTLSAYGRGQKVPDSTARSIEVTLKKPHEWMDRPNYSIDLTNDEYEIILKYRKRHLRGV